MTDLGVECVVGLCMAAAIWWVARRRCRSHTEEPKTRLDSTDPTKAMALTDDAAGAAAAHDALLAEGDSTSEADDDDSSVHSLDEQPHQQQHQQEDLPLNKEEDEDEYDDDDDEAAETDVTDGGDEVIEDEDDNNEDRPLIDEKMMEETMARAMAMAANMGVNMSESFMAMEEFLVLDTPQPAAAVEEERMRMEDPASFVHLDDASIDDSEYEGEEEGEEEEDEDEENEEMEMEMENREKEDMGGEEGECEPSSQGLMSAFWAKCEYKDECNLCHSPFSFLVRRVPPTHSSLSLSVLTLT